MTNAFQVACQGKLVSTTERTGEDSKAISKLGGRGPRWFIIDLCCGQREGMVADKSPDGFFKIQKPKLGGS